MSSIFLKPNNPILRRTAKVIPYSRISSSQTHGTIQKMLKVALGEQRGFKKPIMVGLAAPQIGISKRIILVDVKADGKGKVGQLNIYLNPQIIWASQKKEEWYEGCYSINEVCGIVSRSTSIKVRGFVLKSLGVQSNTPPRWDFIEEKYTGYVARIFQHEIDHLDGKLFIDLIKNPEHLHLVKKSEFSLYRNKEAWRNWPKKYPLPLAYLKLKKV